MVTSLAPVVSNKTPHILSIFVLVPLIIVPLSGGVSTISEVHGIGPKIPINTCRWMWTTEGAFYP